jgi:predicted nucleic acid-binding protein
VQPVILDTDVASLSHKRKLAGPLATRLIGRRPLITFVTFGELTKWAEIRHWGNRNRQALADWLSGVPVLPGDEPVAAMWGRLSAAAVQRASPPGQRYVDCRLLPHL